VAEQARQGDAGSRPERRDPGEVVASRGVATSFGGADDMDTNTIHPPTAAEQGQGDPPDLTTVRETVNILLDPDAIQNVLPPSATEIETLTATLRGHLEVLAHEVEQAARKLKEGSIPRSSALRCVWEARSRLEASPAPGTAGLPVTPGAWPAS
jgi:hypothetical protein